MSSGRPSVRSFEELEKRRSEAMSGEGGAHWSAPVLLLLFIGFGALTLYLIAGPWLGLGPANYTLAEGSAVTAAVLLVAYRLKSRRPGVRRPVKGVLADVMVFIGVVGLTAWTFLFPVFYNVPQGTAIIGVYSLILIGAMIAVFRFTQPGRGASTDGYGDIERSLRLLGAAVEQLGRRMPQDRKVDPAVAERLSAIASEVAAMRKEVSTLKDTVPAGSGRLGALLYGTAGQRTAAPAPGRNDGPVTVVAPLPELQARRPPPRATFSPEAGIAVPDSIVDNPWLDVLKKRRAPSPPGDHGKPG